MSVLSIGVLITSAWTLHGTDQVVDNLRVHLITVLDDKGAERMYLGSKLPDPLVNGQHLARRSSDEVGIVMTDTKGNERSGWGIFPDGQQNLCFDGASGGEIVCLTQGGDEFGGLTIKNKAGTFLSLLGRVGYEEHGVKLFLNDFQGNPRVKLQLEENEDARAKLQLLTKGGDSLFNINEPNGPAKK